MVYDKIHDSNHPRAGKLDELFCLVEKRFHAFRGYYVIREYADPYEELKTVIYAWLDEDYEDYLQACVCKDIKGSPDTSYYRQSSGSSCSSEFSN